MDVMAKPDSFLLTDPLSTLLDSLQIRCRHVDRRTLSADRKEGLPLSTTSLICVTHGVCQITGAFGTIVLSAGELCLILAGPDDGIALQGYGAETTEIITGEVLSLGGPIGPLLQGLTTVQPLRSRPTSLVMELVQQIIDVQCDGRPGGTIIIDQLLTLGVLETLRQQLQDSVLAGPGWLLGLRDAEIGPILLRMLQAPGEQWSLESLAALGTMARSTFARRFRQLVGEAPMDVLTTIRMRAAIQMLRNNGALKDIARQVGYRSVSAFSVAFRRFSGHSPSDYRDRSAPVDMTE